MGGEFDLKEAERVLQWVIRAARNNIQITEQERIEAQCALMGLLQRVGTAAASPLDSPMEGDAGGGAQAKAPSEAGPALDTDNGALLGNWMASQPGIEQWLPHDEPGVGGNDAS